MQNERKRWTRKALLATSLAFGFALMAVSNKMQHDTHSTQTFGVAAAGMFIASLFAWLVACRAK